MSDHCAPECGLHPAGCQWGGFSTGYWIADLDCPLEHRDLDTDPCPDCPFETRPAPRNQENT